MTFMRNIDYSASFMASDIYYILISILEARPPTAINYHAFSDYQIKCFWEAYDAFGTNLKELNERIESYKKMVRILMAEARHIMERDHLITTNSISIANIRGDTEDRRIFQHPSTLIRLAYLLMGILK